MGAQSRECPRTTDGEADGRGRSRVGQIDDHDAIILSEHEVVPVYSPTHRLDELPHSGCAIARVVDEMADGVTGQ